MKFSSFMHEWLYGDNGYYAQKRTIGKEGDFYTAVSTSMFFGGSIANRLLKTIQSGFLSRNCCVVEIGAHKGYLLADMIQFIYTLQPELLSTLTFIIVEPFSENQRMQREYFEEAFGEAIHLQHVSSLEDINVAEAFFVANEIFDAFACEVIMNESMLYMEDNEAIFRPMDEMTKSKALEYGITKGELCLGYEPFALQMASAAQKFEFISFDYGDKEPRHDISLRVYASHQVYPFFGLTHLVDERLREEVCMQELFGRSDITYDVCFSHLIYAFEKAGVSLHQYASQMRALIDFGLIELLELYARNVSEKLYEHEKNRIKTLIDPSFMGERFKMVCFRKGE